MTNITIEDVFVKLCAIESEQKEMWKYLATIARGDETQNTIDKMKIDNYYDRMANWCLTEATRLKNGIVR